MQDSAVSWPPENALTPKEMGRIAYVLDDMLSLPNVQYGGKLSKDWMRRPNFRYRPFSAFHSARFSDRLHVHFALDTGH